MNYEVNRGAGAGNCAPDGLTLEHRGCPPRWKIQAMGFTGALLEGVGEVTTIVAKPQSVFLPKRLSIPSVFTSADVRLVVVRIANQNQSPAAGDQAVETMSEVARDACIWYDLAAAGVDIELDIRNVAGGPLVFTATMFGFVADQRYPGINMAA